MFRPGDLVVCVDDSIRYGLRPCVVRGTVYTVSQMVQADDGIGVVLEEASSHPFVAFNPTRFRPVSKRSTDLLRSMLTDLPSYAEVASSSRPRLPAA